MIEPPDKRIKILTPRQAVDVVLPRRLHAALSYDVGQESVLPGDFVIVPLARREEVGCVWDTSETALNGLPAPLRGPPPSAVAPTRLKTICRKLDTPGLPDSLRRFVDWVAAYTLTPKGRVLAMAMRGWVAVLPKAPTRWCRAASEAPKKLTPARQKVWDVSLSCPLTTKQLADRAGVSPAVVLACAKIGMLREVESQTYAAPERAIVHARPPDLSETQRSVARQLRDAVALHMFAPILLEGVTGSGKTEVYFEAVEESFEMRRQVLVLLPEIALSSQWITRFRHRFGFEPLVWHSSMGDAHRRRVWHDVRAGGPCVVVGARSALFLPFVSLGLIVVDEEHEPAFKQEEGVIYHGRDMAIIRAQQEGVPVVLASATPSLETLANVHAGRYRHLNLPDRHAGACLPDACLVDLRSAPPERGQFLSPELRDACRDTIKRGEQAMLFLNRRGYAPLTLCRHCGHRIECPQCSAWLVEHRVRGRMVCHHCDYSAPVPSRCGACNAEGSLVPVGPGIERITEEARQALPGARILVMSSDTLVTAGSARNAGEKISRREVDLIIGTQLVAKGWHFPDLTLVGVVDSDLGLNGGDLRAAERTVQLLHQVSGRAGRAEKPGRVLLQTYCPEHPAMKALASQDFHRFMAQEANARRPGFWPPYGRLAALVISASTPQSADLLARDLALNAPRGEGIAVLGPAPAPLSKLRGRHRRRLLLRAHRSVAVQPILWRWLATVKCKSDQRIVIDIDPISFF